MRYKLNLSITIRYWKKSNLTQKIWKITTSHRTEKYNNEIKNSLDGFNTTEEKINKPDD